MRVGVGVVPAGPMVASVQVGLPAPLRGGERVVRSAIVKAQVTGSVPIGVEGLEGDRQADRRVHGGPDKAVYAYAAEDYRWWSAQLDRADPLRPGTFGENLTTVGLDLGSSALGDRWRVGSVVLEVAQPRSPCAKLGMRMGDPCFPDRFTAAARPGAYLRVLVPGSLAAGDPIEVDPAPPPTVTISEVFAAPRDVDLARRVLADPRVPASWASMAARRMR